MSILLIADNGVQHVCINNGFFRTCKWPSNRRDIYDHAEYYNELRWELVKYLNLMVCWSLDMEAVFSWYWKWLLKSRINSGAIFISLISLDHTQREEIL